MTEYKIRKAVVGDETVLAYIQTESWKAAFNDILSSDVLNKCTDINRATAMYKRLLDNQIGNGYILEVEGKPHMIAYWDATREDDMSGYAELICIHSLPNNWRKGYGSKMMAHLLNDIVEAGFNKTMLWVFEKNDRARRFYEANGFVKSHSVKKGFDATEVMYVRDNFKQQ